MKPLRQQGRNRTLNIVMKNKEEEVERERSCNAYYARLRLYSTTALGSLI